MYVFVPSTFSMTCGPSEHINMHDIVCNIFTSITKEASFHVIEDQLHVIHFSHFRHLNVISTLSFPRVGV